MLWTGRDLEATESRRRPDGLGVEREDFIRRIGWQKVIILSDVEHSDPKYKIRPLWMSSFRSGNLDYRDLTEVLQALVKITKQPRPLNPYLNGE